jgi:hypothetical protein
MLKQLGVDRRITKKPPADPRAYYIILISYP